VDNLEPMSNRYIRQIDLPGIGREGQDKIEKAKVLVVGLGGLGSPVAYYLAAAGVGHIDLLDNDTIAPNNLNRQILYDTNRVDMDKVESAKQRLSAFNPDINYNIVRTMVTRDNAADVTRGYDLIMSCVDNIKARRNLNHGSKVNNIPLVDGAVQLYSGYVLPIIPGKTPCYNCALGNLEHQDVPKPILGSVAGTVGTLMVTEAIKILCGIESDLLGHILLCDFLEMSFIKAKTRITKYCNMCQADFQ